MKDDWAVDVWNEACLRAKERPDLLPQGEEACLFLSYVARLHSDFSLHVAA